MRAASSSTLTSYWVISPRTSTSSCWATSPASAVKIRPSFSVSGMPGRTSSAITPPCTLTASGTSSPDSASRTDLATAMPAFSCASSVEAPEVRGRHDVLELEQRAVGARLVGEHVEPGRGDPALLDRVVAARASSTMPPRAALTSDQARLDHGQLRRRRSGRPSRGSSAGAREMKSDCSAAPRGSTRRTPICAARPACT